MARHWTDEERRRQAAIILSWKPWEHSTGPKTLEGKETSSRNSLIHGCRSEDFIQLKKAIRKQKDILLNFNT